MRATIGVLLVILGVGCTHQAPTRKAAGGDSLRGAPSEYASEGACAACHADIYRKYRRTGMGRSFSPARRDLIPTGPSGQATYYHPASDRHYTVMERGGRFYLRRHQSRAGGEPFNVLEKQIDFVMGSGNHARTYLHRTAAGKLMELPLAWYAEGGGHWAMNPGYDRRDHPGFRRAIPDDCMFCHNGYPKLDPGSRAHGADATFPAKLPEGIDCQRCHGPGRAHIEAAAAGKPASEARLLIYNPGRQSVERQLEVCMQCHLESTSRALPYSIVRFDREPYSYRPAEPLASYVIHFDYPPGKGPEDHFEIAHAAYRLRKSRCFTATGGTLVCTRCHDPHEAKRGPEAERQYTAVCRGCHRSAHAGQRRDSGCTDCHMPKRRTDDVVHVVMTDHLIRRSQPGRNLLAPRAEIHESEQTAYRGEVALYYPPALPEGPAGELYEATAQVYAGANLQAGIARLEKAIRRHNPPQPEFYHQLAEACFRTGNDAAAVEWYRQALQRDGAYLPAIRNLGATLNRMGRASEAAEVLRRAPDDPAALTNLGEALISQGQAAAAVQALRRSLEADPDSVEALNNLGRALARTGDHAGASEAWRSAIRVRPDFAKAHNNLANLMNAAGRWEEARQHFEEALRDPTFALARYNYGSALAQRGALDLAERLLSDAVRMDRTLAEAYLNLGNIHAMKGNPRQAIVHFQNALQVNPGLAQARLNLGIALAELGRTAEALEQLRRAALNPDAEIRRIAESAIEQVSRQR